MKCSDCRFWVESEARNWGDCHRFPPKIYKDKGYGRLWVFPEVSDRTWCGEFKEKED